MPEIKDFLKWNYLLHMKMYTLQAWCKLWLIFLERSSFCSLWDLPAFAIQGLRFQELNERQDNKLRIGVVISAARMDVTSVLNKFQAVLS